MPRQLQQAVVKRNQAGLWGLFHPPPSSSAPRAVRPFSHGGVFGADPGTCEEIDSQLRPSWHRIEAGKPRHRAGAPNV